MSALLWLEQVDEGAMLALLVATLVGLAVACAPPMPPRRLPALARRPRDTGRY